MSAPREILSQGAPAVGSDPGDPVDVEDPVRSGDSAASSGSGRSRAKTMSAVPIPRVWPTAMFTMLTPAEPTEVATEPIIPGRSSLRTTRRNSVGPSATS
jgi:hypothetical protein